ncbi:GNAT family N-acetyltransferase [Burkholderia gladioli]|uniref:GNAT family N-acetyltransferase n=1 Tax=Burkholderia gladioli TaxID=28095 RepID=UPI00163ECFD4|nr:GNAT family N-acetyltransferase [Burkholderia gladioli]
MIRDATVDDIPSLVELGARMAAESPRYRRLAFSGEKLAALFTRLIEWEDGFLMVAEHDGEQVGVMAACVLEHWMSTDRVASEFGLFVLPEHRGRPSALRLARAYQSWARTRGAREITFGISTGVHVEQTARFYRAIGLVDAGLIFEVPNV